MKNLIYDIQTNETSGQFPFKLFYNENVITTDHCHTEIEIIYIIKGESNVCVNGVHYKLREGDVMIASSGDIHSIEYSVQRRMVVQFKLDMLKELYAFSEDIDYIYKKLHSSARVSSKWSVKTARRVEASLKELGEAARRLNNTEYRLKVYAVLYRLIDIFTGELPEDEEQKQKLRLLSNKKDYAKIERMFVYIHDNFDKNITLEQIAAQFHYSTNYFTKLWKKYIGTSFHQYLNEYRVTVAMKLLKETDLLISDIAYRTGFQSIKSFNRVFKQITHINPTEYREAEK